MQRYVFIQYKINKIIFYYIFSFIILIYCYLHIVKYCLYGFKVYIHKEKPS